MLNVEEGNGICISCSNKEKSVKHISITKDKGVYKGYDICSFNLCNECLNKLSREFHKFC